jgi:hypothetical protein
VKWLSAKILPLILMAVGQLNVPLANFFINNIFLVDLPMKSTVLLICIVIAIQVVGLCFFYFCAIRATRGWENKSILARSLSENYKPQFGYWIFVETWYDILNSLVCVVASRYNRNIYWASFGLRLTYTCLHTFLQPSKGIFHNIHNISVGFAHVLEDIAILEDIYGKGKLNQGPAWFLVCLALPEVIGIALGIWGICRAKRKEAVENLQDSEMGEANVNMDDLSKGNDTGHGDEEGQDHENEESKSKPKIKNTDSGIEPLLEFLASAMAGAAAILGIVAYPDLEKVNFGFIVVYVVFLSVRTAGSQIGIIRRKGKEDETF